MSHNKLILYNLHDIHHNRVHINEVPYFHENLPLSLLRFGHIGHSLDRRYSLVVCVRGCGGIRTHG